MLDKDGKKWFYEKTGPNETIVKAVRDPLPPGPYLVIRQHGPVIGGCDWLTVLRQEVVVMQNMVSGELGTSTFAKVNGKCELVAYNWDTSD